MNLAVLLLALLGTPALAEAGSRRALLDPRGISAAFRPFESQDEDDLAAARETLENGTEKENGNEYRAAVSQLLADGSEPSIELLRRVLVETDVPLKAEVILQGFAVQKRLDILRECLAVLGKHGGNGRVSLEAQNYLKSLVRSADQRRATVSGVAELLTNASASEADLLGAARAAKVVLDLGLVVPLADALDRATSSGVRQELHSALTATTYEDFGRQGEAWREWRRSINGRARNELADRKIEDMRGQLGHVHRRLAETIGRMLSEATAEQASAYLEDELEAVRLAAQARLLTLATRAEADPGLSNALAPVAARLQSFVDAEGAGALSDREVASLARLYVRLAPEDCRPLLLSVFEKTAIESGLHLELLDSLVAVASGPDDEAVAQRLFALADGLPSDDDKVKVLAALTGLGGAPTLNYLASHLGGGSDKVREASVVAAAAVAGKLGDSQSSYTLFELLLSRLEEDESERVRTSVSKALVDVVGTLEGDLAAAAFDELQAAMRAQLGAEARDERRFLELGRALCKVPGLSERALAAVSGMLEDLGAGPESAVPAAALLRRIKELVAPASTSLERLVDPLGSILSYLPVGGGSPDRGPFTKVEIEAIGAWTGLLNRVAGAELGPQQDFLRKMAKQAEECGQIWWAAHALDRLVGLENDATEASRLQWERAGLLLRFVGNAALPPEVRALGARDAWNALAQFASPSTGSPRRALPEGIVERTILERLVLDLGPLLGPIDGEADGTLVADAARWAESLVAVMQEGEQRRALALERCAWFLRHAGEEERALARYEQLLGPGGSGSTTRPAGELLVRSLLDLAELYLNRQRPADARTALQALPSNLGAPDKSRREALQKRLSESGSSQPGRGGAP